MAIRLINPKGAEIEVPDSWAGVQLQQMVEKGFKVIHEKVEIPTIEVVKVEQKITDPEPLEELEVHDLEVPEIPIENLRVIEKGTNKLRRLKGHGTRRSKIAQASRKKKVKNG